MSTDCECPICYDTLIASKTGKAEMTCGHAFHLKCLADWFSTSSNSTTCPMCRKAATELEIPTTRHSKPIEVVSSRNDRILQYTNYTYNNNNIILHIDNSQIIHIPFPDEEIPRAQTDTELVATQSGVDYVTAADALQRTNGDIVDAILDITTPGCRDQLQPQAQAQPQPQQNDQEEDIYA